MQTIFSMFLLVIYGGIAGFLMLIVLNIAGLPGALLAGVPGKRSKLRFIFGSIISAISQSYVNFAIVAFMVSWTHLAAQRSDVIGFLVWPVAFFAVAVPTLTNLIRARTEARELWFLSAQVVALHFTALATLLTFPLFAFVPILMKAWIYVPLVSSVVEGN